MPRIAPYADRVARYERIIAMRGGDPERPKMSLDEIAEALGPDPLTGEPLTRQRVQQIIDRPPRPAGRPASVDRIDRLRRKLAGWEQRRARAREKGRATEREDNRIRALSEELARLSRVGLP